MDIFVYITLCFTSLFTLMDPLGVMPVFLQMTDGMDTKERRCIALKACTIAFIILVLFTLSGRLEKPLNFDPFGHARFAHLFVLYD